MNRSFILFSIFILLSAWGGKVRASDSLLIGLDEILFFASGSDVPDKANREYNLLFSPETKYVNIELNVNNLNYQVSDQSYDITFIWKYFNGDEFGRAETAFNVKAGWSSAYINRGWGFTGTPNWQIGRFTAQVLVNGSLFAEKDFFITPFNKEFISFSPSAQNIEELEALAGSMKYEVVQQLAVEPQPFLNYFYDIHFSHDGQHIAYNIAHYEHTESNSGTSTTRYMYLFKDNKQLLPEYFIIHYDFDENLEDLSFFTLKLTSGNIYEAEGKGYYNGWHIYNSNAYIGVDVSPDKKKYTYILNTMPRMKSSFTWDNAYEYCMINNKKVQPEFLKMAKSIRITKNTSSNFFRTKSLAYVRNPDNTYNAVYSAKYKFDNDTWYALFNEGERISGQFDGYISVPYVSPDANNVAYIVQDGKEYFIMMNDKKITGNYDQIKHEGIFSKVNNEIIFTGEGRDVIYQAKIKGDWYLMKGDETISDGFSEIESVTLGPGHRQVAYKAKTGRKWSIYLNKQKISGDFKNMSEEIAMSTDGKHVAYAASDGDYMFVMIDGKKVSPDMEVVKQNSMEIGRQPLAIGNFVFNREGSQVAYVVTYDHSGDDIVTKIKHAYIMVNDKQISPKMYSAALHSIKPGELYYAGFDIDNMLLHHIKVDF